MRQAGGQESTGSPRGTTEHWVVPVAPSSLMTCRASLVSTQEVGGRPDLRRNLGVAWRSGSRNRESAPRKSPS